MATSRQSRGSRAWYTSPIPPTPRGARISYEPSRVPVERVTDSSCAYLTPIVVRFFRWRELTLECARLLARPALPQSVPADRHAPERTNRLTDIGAFVVPVAQAARRIQPSERSLDDPPASHPATR